MVLGWLVTTRSTDGIVQANAVVLYALWKTPQLARIVGLIWLAAGAVIYWIESRAAASARPRAASDERP